MLILLLVARLRARYAMLTDVGPSVVRPVVISRKLSKIERVQHYAAVGTADSVAALASCLDAAGDSVFI